MCVCLVVIVCCPYICHYIITWAACKYMHLPHTIHLYRATYSVDPCVSTVYRVYRLAKVRCGEGMQLSTYDSGSGILSQSILSQYSRNDAIFLHHSLGLMHVCVRYVYHDSRIPCCSIVTWLLLVLIVPNCILSPLSRQSRHVIMSGSNVQTY